MFFYFAWNHLNYFIRLIVIIIFVSQISSYTYTFLVNPGIPRKNDNFKLEDSENNLKQGYKFCNQCKIILKLDSNTNHCQDCNVCIEGRLY